MSKCYRNAIDRAITKHGGKKIREFLLETVFQSGVFLRLSYPRDRSSSNHRSNERRKTISCISEGSLRKNRRINYSLPLSTKVPCSTHVPRMFRVRALERECMPYRGPSVRFVNATACNKRVKSRFHGSTRESFHETG